MVDGDLYTEGYWAINLYMWIRYIRNFDEHKGHLEWYVKQMILGELIWNAQIAKAGIFMSTKHLDIRQSKAQ
jgi:hypothetical protein